MTTIHKAQVETSGMLGQLEYTGYCPCGWEAEYARHVEDDAQDDAARHVAVATRPPTLPAQVDLIPALRWVLSVEVSVERGDLPRATLTTALAVLSFATGLPDTTVLALARNHDDLPAATYHLPPL
jgi:hypothetical protein